MKLIFIFFLVGICGLGEGMIKEYFYIPSGRTWQDAQTYCRQVYRDLATFNTTEEHQRVIKVFGNQNQPIWIGLNRQTLNSNWQWCDGDQVSFLPWYPGYPINYYVDSNGYHECNCAYLYQEHWPNTFCWNGLYFYCYRHLILVNKTNTWEEALNYCTTHYTGLASLPYATQVNQATLELALTQTDNVWTGLYFMDGKWLWLSGETPVNLDSLTSCPARPYHCGAFNKTFTLENRDCNEKLNFLCYQN